MRRSFSVRSADTPAKLQLATAVTVLAGIALAIGGWYAIDRRDTAIDDAAAAARQLIQVQDVRVQVVQADSLASNAYLQAGQEDPAVRAAYDERLGEASSGLVAAARAATLEDAATLESVNRDLAAYAGLVEQARANNRQGFPVGAAYQREARQLASELVVSLRTVEQSTRQRVEDSMERASRSSWLLVLTAVAALAVLLLGSWWLARRWRRLINVPIALAALITFVVLVFGVGVNASAMSTARDAVRGELSAADLVAQARAAGFDARASEALTLINRGNGAAYEQQWQLSASVVELALEQACDRHDVGCGTLDDHLAYADGHRLVRELDDAGDWDGAVRLATGGALDGVDPSRDFERFAASSSTHLAEQSAAAGAAFDEADDSLGRLRVLVVVAGLAVAVLGAAGYAQRLREYR
ncbi:unannotated protein [freshwater metagenome]|uniref:Unannotated protein n=1 Tax=freshwater metagenome TaxID=449393 RepID=A0A6J6FIV2_9ZZZZ